ncbi:hypothetical protein [Chryseobacterium joostei]|uniref:ATP-dependent DNA ligase n=1 Tax=Chryseobacterium joostei TaxID=112234 RepID=UPI0023F1214B|nr:hypothetical protein [Chryseobacterium joostei]
MLCKTSEKPFDDKDWAFEIKWDGYRAITDIKNAGIRFYSRNGLDLSKSFKKIADALRIQRHEMVVDGKIVAYDDKGKPNFQWLQRIAEQQTDVPISHSSFKESISFILNKNIKFVSICMTVPGILLKGDCS